MTSRRLTVETLEPRVTPVVLTITVTTATDEFDFSNADVSLREAIFQADNFDPTYERVDIVFDPSLAGAFIPVTHGGGSNFFGQSGYEVDSGQPIVIRGSGQRITYSPSSDGLDLYRLFAVGPAGRLTLEDLELHDGIEVVGGGIYNEGTLTVNRCTITGNVATGGDYFIPPESFLFTSAYGGGIYNRTGTATITNSTITGNQARDVISSDVLLAGRGGGVANEDGTLTLIYTTVANNTAAQGTQAYNFEVEGTARLTVNFSILSQAGSPTLPALVSTATSGTASGVRNLIRGATGFTGEIVSTDDPLLGPLANNGGLTRTLALPINSPAVNLGEPRGGTSVAADQRGVPRAAVGLTGRFSDLGAFEVVLPASQLSGFVYSDTNDNGVFDSGESPIAGVLITLTDGVTTLTTTTGADGRYTFSGLEAGTYTVTETQPAGYFDGKDTAGSRGGTVTDDRIADILLNPGDNATNYLFGELAPARLRGFVYADANNNGVRDAGESGIAGVVVTLAGPVTRTATTAADGSYSFDALPYGTYTVTEAQPAGFFDGKDTAGSRGGTVTDDRIADILLNPGDDGVNYLFGELAPARLSGFVYADANNNGIKDLGEAGIPGVIVSLTSGSTTRAATTGADGSYSFTDLPFGTYTIAETQPAGFRNGKVTPGSRGGVAVGNTITGIVLGTGDDSVGNNFGELTLLPPVLVAGAGSGGGPHVKVFNAVDGSLVSSFFAFDPAFSGGVRVAQGDFNGDGVADIVAAAGPGGGPHVKVFDGATGAVLRSFYAYDPVFAGGVWVAAADVTGDGVADIVTGAGLGGGPHVKVFDGATGATILSFFAYPLTIDCGVTVACTGGQIVTGTGFGHPQFVKVFDARTGAEQHSFTAFDTPVLDGVFVAALPADGPPLVFAVRGGDPEVRRFAGSTPSGSFAAFDTPAVGASITAGDFDRDPTGDVAVGAGLGGSPFVRIFSGVAGAPRLTFLAFDAGFRGGVFVG